MLNWREIPFVRLLLPFAVGILLAIQFNLQIPGLPIAFLALVALQLLSQKLRGLYRYRWMPGLLLTAALLVLGYGITLQHNELNHDTHFSKTSLPEAGAMLVGEVADAPALKEKWVKIELEISGSGPDADSLAPASGNLLLYLERDSASELLAYGDQLVLQGKATTIEPPANPHAFDYGRYLRFQNIHYHAFVKNGSWGLVKKHSGFSVYGTAISLQHRFTETLRKHLKTENEFAVGAALIFGYRSEVPEEVLTAYSQTGAIHILAVSGMHVGILFLILNFFLKQVKTRHHYWRWAKAGILLAVIWSFALVTGASPSVLRSTTMFSFVIMADAMGRNKNFYNTLTASAFCLLLYDPYWLHSVSFQLSYLAILGIVYFQPKIAGLWVIENKPGNYLWELTSVSLAAQLMTLPFTLLYFHQFPTYFWLSSLVLVPLAGFEMGLGLLLLVLDQFWAMGANAVGWLLWALLKFGNESVLFIRHLPAALVSGIWMGGISALLLYLSLGSLMAAISSRKFRWALAALTLLAVVGISFAFSEFRHRKNRQLTIYSVYKHTAIDFFDGEKAWSLIDTALEAKPLKYAAESNRFANGINAVEMLHLEDTTALVGDHFFYENGLVQFYDKRLFVVSGPVAYDGEEKVKLDFLLLRNTPKVELEDLLQIFDFQLLVFDASNKHWRVDNWKAECDSLGVSYFDVDEEGALVVDLKE
ncbi:MAG: ComEC family competence protein [Saprospiraceae bacterium]|nr:ComEC family competence protein [Saprospiraceae bacterium]MCF8252328.1 ComEC family competence protein [Saprospiraceae bacterium]MCF8282299.1 ComEC family competence protein [Bacteroidales bacterium]MCF8313761.1 ComEC family competence protein [Saprospiraceae bacterium]MCF8442467.1 ComEC family competence protein [Saprospiraceae bacterium]